MQLHDTIRAIVWKKDRLALLDQRLLPAEERYLEMENAGDVARAIRDMVVRGAPAIGITAAYGVVLAARNRHALSRRTWKEDIQQDLDMLVSARPTAVNLAWAISRMSEAMAGIEGDPFSPLLALAESIHQEDITANRRMGELGAELLPDRSRVLTHCNTGSLATGGYGTALGVIRSAFGHGKVKMVYADETRPWLQGSRLTAWELVRDRIPVTVLVEGAAAQLMRNGRVSWAIVGADRIAVNGDTANKIGTYSLAVVARHHGVKFMVVAPSSTVDMSIGRGEDIPIEMRSPDEVLTLAGRRVAASGAEGLNPAFDVTPAGLIDAIVTEKGVVLDPTPEKMASMMQH